jgi:hypothetical protein
VLDLSTLEDIEDLVLKKTSVRMCFYMVPLKVFCNSSWDVIVNLHAPLYIFTYIFH